MKIKTEHIACIVGLSAIIACLYGLFRIYLPNSNITIRDYLWLGLALVSGLYIFGTSLKIITSKKN